MATERETLISVGDREAELVKPRTMIVQPMTMSGVTGKGLYAYWYETSETVIVKVLDVKDPWWVKEGDVLLVPPHSVEPLTLSDGVIMVCHEANAIARVEGTGR